MSNAKETKREVESKVISAEYICGNVRFLTNGYRITPTGTNDTIADLSGMSRDNLRDLRDILTMFIEEKN